MIFLIYIHVKIFKAWIELTSFIIFRLLFIVKCLYYKILFDSLDLFILINDYFTTLIKKIS